MRYVLVAIGVWTLLGLAIHTGALRTAYTQVSQMASVFFVESSTPQILYKAYAEAKKGEKFKILIVPGHDDVASGATFGGLREADLALAVGERLAKEFEDDRRIQATLARDSYGYIPELALYFDERRQDILNYRATQTAQMKEHLSSGAIESHVVVNHNFAPSEVAVKLYGINKWANEQGYDLILHLHFNDVPRPDRSRPGWPSGFALYVPERQFSNAKGSMAVAEAIKARLIELYRPSTLPQESPNPTEDQELIAVGSNNSLDASSVLIEYAYIYEPLVQFEPVRAQMLAGMAQQTYLGVRDFLTESI